jgi:single-strand DNA-binding protein
MFNQTILVGHLGGAPELRYTQNQKAVLNFSMATSSAVPPSRDGEEWGERTEWHRVVIWGPRAEGLSKILGKGFRVCIVGELRTREWQDKQDNTQRTTEVHASEVLLLDSKKGGA